MKFKTTLIVLLIGGFGTAQELTCNDFKKGTFYIPTERKIDTLYIFRASENKLEKIPFENDSNMKQIVVLRGGNSQTEWINAVDNGEPTHEKIKWIDQCTYILTKDEEKHELDENDIFISQNGGLLVEIIEIVGKCMKYKSSITTENGDKMYTIANICAE